MRASLTFLAVAATALLVASAAAQSCPSFDVVLSQSPASLEYTRYGQVLSSDVTCLGGAPVPANVSVTYAWTETTTGLVLDDTTMNQPQLYIKAWTLQPGTTHTFRLDVTSAAATGSATVNVTVPVGDIEVRVLGGTVREVSKLVDFFIKVAVLDTDERRARPSVDDRDYYINWDCVSMPDGGMCPMEIYDEWRQTANVRANTLIPGDWVIRANATHTPSGRFGEHQVTIRVLPDNEETPTVMIDTFYSTVPANTRVVLQGDSISYNGNLDFWWDNTAGPYINWNDDANFHTSTNDQVLVIAPGVLEPGQVYTFELKAEDQDREYGYAYFELTVEDPPSGGACTTDREVGIEYDDAFTVTCAGWTSAKLPLRYHFHYARGEADRHRHTVAITGEPRLEPTATAVFPTGDGSQSNVFVICDIIDAVGATARVEVNVTVNPKPVADLNAFVSTELITTVANAHGTGDSHSAMGYLNILADMINYAEQDGEYMPSREALLASARTFLSAQAVTDATVTQHATFVSALTRPSAVAPSETMRDNIATYLKNITAAAAATETLTDLAQQAILEAIEELSTADALAACTDTNAYARTVTLISVLDDMFYADKDNVVCGQEAEHYRFGHLTFAHQSLHVRQIRGYRFQMFTQYLYMPRGSNGGWTEAPVTVQFPDKDLFLYDFDEEDCVQIRTWSLGVDTLSAVTCDASDRPQPTSNTVIHGLTIWDLLFDEEADVGDLQIGSASIDIQIPKVPLPSHVDDGGMEDLCSFYDHDDRAWETSGCQTISNEKYFVRCECEHLTEFVGKMVEEKDIDWSQVSGNTAPAPGGVSPGVLAVVIVGGVVVVLGGLGAVYAVTKSRKRRAAAARATVSRASSADPGADPKFLAAAPINDVVVDAGDDFGAPLELPPVGGNAHHRSAPGVPDEAATKDVVPVMVEDDVPVAVE